MSSPQEEGVRYFGVYLSAILSSSFVLKCMDQPKETAKRPTRSTSTCYDPSFWKVTKARAASRYRNCLQARSVLFLRAMPQLTPFLAIFNIPLKENKYIATSLFYWLAYEPRSLLQRKFLHFSSNVNNRCAPQSEI